MVGLIVVLVLAVLATPVIAVIALVSANTALRTTRDIETRLRAIESDRRSAETTVASQAASPPLHATPPLPVTTPTPELTAGPHTSAPSASVTPTPTPPPSPSPPPRPSRTAGFEEQFGSRWLVWVGGIALALGGIFLVRYTIQQGLVGPGVRITLGGLLALALIAIGEWQRRKENQSRLAILPSANIPSILTAAGTTVAYATVYAAYALYGFLPPQIAFVLLGIVALLTLGAALLHGPVVAGLGVIGAYVAPMLVSSAEPDFWALYIYIAVINAAAFALARLRLWYLIALAALVLGALWALPGIDLNGLSVVALNAHIFHATSGFALAAGFLVCGFLYGPPPASNEIDSFSTLSLSIYLLVATLLVLASQHDPVTLTAFVILTIATVAIAWRAEAATGAVTSAAVLAMVVMAHWAVRMNVTGLLEPSGPTAPAIPEPEYFAYGSHFTVAALWAALFGVAGFLAQGRSARALVPMVWSVAGVFAPLAMLAALYYRVTALDRSLPFAGLALLLAAIYGVATENLMKRERQPGLMAAGAIYATGTLAALALTLTFALEKGWLTVGLALMSPGAAWIAAKRPIPWLRWLSAIMAAIVVARIGYDPRIVGDALGTRPIFNWLLYGYGVPAAAFWLAGWLLRKQADDIPARIVDAGAILLTVLLASMEIRHYANGGNIYQLTPSTLEIMLDVNVGVAITIGLERIRGRSGSIVHNIAAVIMAVATLAVILADLATALSPQFRNFAIPGGPLFNTILLGYGLPAILAISLALIARTTRPMPYRITAAITFVVLSLFYLTLEVQRLFHGPILRGAISDAEQYTFSTVWLVFGIALLTAGFALRSQPARLLALGVISLTIAKVFILDTASISGIYRALSVIGLGVVLLGIGWVYQHLLFPQAPAGAAVGHDRPS
jgi:uncharacterized membrane protein